MKKNGKYLLLNMLCVFSITAFSFMTVPGFTAAENDSEWPETTRYSRPWVYWWWLGSAVDKNNITVNLTDLHKAGVGGVHIVPIYGVKGFESEFIPYLSSQWTEMLAHTVAEAEKLDMGVDMTSGTGWPFGGPQITQDNAASMMKIEEYNVDPSRYLVRYYSDTIPQAVVAKSAAGVFIDLTNYINPVTKKLEWNVPEGDWKVYAVSQIPTGQKVKRAAPGAEGLVMNYFSEKSLRIYLSRFDSAFAPMKKPIGVRAFYNDSYEVYKSNWTGDLFSRFKAFNGYDLKNYIPELAGIGESDTVSRVGHDFNETVSTLLLERFTKNWVTWSHSYNSLTRNQAHGSPGNLLDLYAAADIPETEAFGNSRIEIPGLRKDPVIPDKLDKPDILVQKFASSAAHVTGKKLVSSESCTWLGEHFRVSLAQVKPEIDNLFLAGINHVFFHGSPYSPAEAPWPGWLFYAATDFGPTNTIRRDMPELDSYIARCQSFLQSGKPANDILLYWPVHDIWMTPADEDRLHHFMVHNAKSWLYGTSFHSAAEKMKKLGYSFDYISDTQLSGTEISGKDIISCGNSYRVLVVPDAKYMSSKTLGSILNIAADGANVIFVGNLPSDSPGLKNLEKERTALSDMIAGIKFKNDGDIETASYGKGRIYRCDNMEYVLAKLNVPREFIADKEIGFIKRDHGDGFIYFLANFSSAPMDGWVELSGKSVSAVIFDPVSGKTGKASLRKKGGKSQIYLQLLQGQSLIIRTFTGKKISAGNWDYIKPAGDPVEIKGQWRVEFIDGGPEIPDSYVTDRLVSWTENADKKALSFAGTARYSVNFKKPASTADLYVLDLGKVCESARVNLNGRYLGAAWCLPNRITFSGSLLKEDNRLEIEVTNLAANRIADMDRRKVQWRIFYDINFASITYKPFDASTWEPLESGLIGPVMLVPAVQ